VADSTAALPQPALPGRHDQSFSTVRSHDESASRPVTESRQKRNRRHRRHTVKLVRTLKNIFTLRNFQHFTTGNIMNHIADSFFLTHALELRLLVAVTVLPATYAAIQLTSFIARRATAILAKFNSFGASTAATGSYSAAGAR
jgi:hypothetical protein